MATFKDKISSLINQQAPEFVLEQHPKFLEFLKTYYTFMESAELHVTSVQTTDGILLETETAQSNELILDGSRLDTDRTQLDAGDKILLESSSFGKFTRGETVTGTTSKATATVLAEDLTNGKLFISAQNKFKDGEIITGNSSEASAIINDYKPNPVNNIQELLNFRDPDKTISNFLTKFRNEFLNSLPDGLDEQVDKRKLIKNIKSLYRSKGTNRGHELFFKLLFNLESEVIYPRDQMLRASDGQWDSQLILRAIQSTGQLTTGETADLVGRTITGETSGATAVIENVFKFQIGVNTVTEFILNEDTITGTFSVSEVIRGTTSDDDDYFIKATVTGIPKTVTITNDGSLYTVGDVVSLTGGGEGALVNVEGIGRGSLQNFFVDSGGTGYEIGDDIVFNDTDTGGGSARAKVSVVNGGFTPESGVETDSESHIVLEDETVRGDPYTGNKIVQESGSGSNDITDIRIIDSGSNYQSLPIVTVDDTNGSNASIFTYGDEIGKVQLLNIVESGAEHQLSPSPPTIALRSKLLLLNRSGNFVAGETVTGVAPDSTVETGTVIALDTDRNILTLSGGNFQIDSTITSTGGGSATVKIMNQATATTTIGSTTFTSGSFLNEDGHLSETTMKIQDSLYYQDFSYVIKVGRSINDWRDSFKQTMHTGGFYFTGQVNITSRIDAQLRSFTGLNSSESYTQIASILNTLFSTILGRRLGTTTDGTTLRVSPELGVDPDFSDSTRSLLTDSTRDVTLNQSITLKLQNLPTLTVRGISLKHGYALAGPRMQSINRFYRLYSGSDHPQVSTVGATGDSSITTNISPMTMRDWGQFRLGFTKNTTLDGEVAQFRDFFTPDLKTNLAFPTEIKVG
tara:strand:- start:843 stop:3422 length:2580 start_codon:yes stop_codon:yes gene_type:complete